MMTKKDILKWKSGFEAARKVDCHLIRQEPVDPERSIRLALELIAVCRKLGIWSKPGSDILRERQVKIIREQWATIRKAFGK